MHPRRVERVGPLFQVVRRGRRPDEAARPPHEVGGEDPHEGAVLRAGDGAQAVRAAFVSVRKKKSVSDLRHGEGG